MKQQIKVLPGNANGSLGRIKIEDITKEQYHTINDVLNMSTPPYLPLQGSNARSPLQVQIWEEDYGMGIGRCMKCQQEGHTANQCKNTQVCDRCHVQFLEGRCPNTVCSWPQNGSPAKSKQRADIYKNALIRTAKAVQTQGKMLACRDVVTAQLGDHSDVKVAGPNKDVESVDRDSAVMGLLATAAEERSAESKDANQDNLKKASEIAMSIRSNLHEIKAFDDYPEDVKQQLTELQFTNVTQHMSEAMKKMVRIMLSLNKTMAKPKPMLNQAATVQPITAMGGAAIGGATGQSGASTAMVFNQTQESTQLAMHQNDAMASIAKALQGLAQAQADAAKQLAQISSTQQQSSIRLAALEEMVFKPAGPGRGKRPTGVGPPPHQSTDVG